MNRNEIIEHLLQNIRWMNAGRIAQGQTSQEEVDAFIEEERTRLSKMSDLQLKNMLLINC